MDELVAIAKIVKARGLRGETAAEVLTDFPARFEGLDKVTAVLPSGDRRPLRIEGYRFQKDRVLLKFTGVDNIEAAEELRNAEICVFESEAVELETDEFFDWQLAGCDVETVEGIKIGRVRDVMRTGGTDVLMIDGHDRELMVPFAEAICIEVDVERKLIVVDPPEGLLDL